MSRSVTLSSLFFVLALGMADAQCGGGGCGMMSGMGGMGGMMSGGMGGGSCCCCPPPCPQPVQLMLCPPQQSCCCPPPCPQPVQLMMCCPPKPCCCPQPMQQSCCPPPCCPPPCCMDQPKQQCCQLMLIPTGQEVMMPCPKPCCCCPQQSSGGCGGMMGRRKRRSLALYRRNGLYERLAAAELQSRTAAAYGSAFSRAKFATAAKTQAAAYGCIPCACPTDSASPLSRLLKKYKV